MSSGIFLFVFLGAAALGFLWAAYPVMDVQSMSPRPLPPPPDYMRGKGDDNAE